MYTYVVGGNECPHAPAAPNVLLLRPLWSLLDGLWGVLKGSWGVLAGRPEIKNHGSYGYQYGPCGLRGPLNMHLVMASNGSCGGYLKGYVEAHGI